jgi:hypothetical protein
LLLRLANGEQRRREGGFDGLGIGSCNPILERERPLCPCGQGLGIIELLKF